MNSEGHNKPTKTQDKILNGQVKYCSACKRRFIQSHQNIYKLDVKGKKLKFCSYGCFRRIQVLKENREYDLINEILQQEQKVV